MKQLKVVSFLLQGIKLKKYKSSGYLYRLSLCQAQSPSPKTASQLELHFLRKPLRKL